MLWVELVHSPRHVCHASGLWEKWQFGGTRWIGEKGGGTEVNTLSCKRWTGVNEKGLSGIQAKGKSWQRWELGSNETSTSELYPMTRRGGGVLFSWIRGSLLLACSRGCLSWDDCSTNVVLDLFESSNLDLFYRQSESFEFGLLIEIIWGRESILIWKKIDFILRN